MKHIWLVSIITGCYSSWEAKDIDNDGIVGLDDCWESSEDPVPPEGALDHGVKAKDIYKGAVDLPYDGIDANCDGKDDFDQDEDGFVPTEYLGIVTIGLNTSGRLSGGDCYDSPDLLVVADGLEDHGLSGADVYPHAEDFWYDGIDSDCAGNSDFDQDDDGFVSSLYENIPTMFVDADPLPVGDCFDSLDDEFFDPTGLWMPADVNVAVEEIWYDGADIDCSGESDCDKDGDGFDTDFYNCIELIDPEIPVDCNDENEALFPNPTIAEIFYNGIDDNCDYTDQDGDKDGDGHWDMNYPFVTSADLSVRVPSVLDDCWDDHDNIPQDFDAINGFAQPTADSVYPEAHDAFYDGVDQDCAGMQGEYDQDGDGFDSLYHANRVGNFGEDCVDSVADHALGHTSLSPADIYPNNPQDIVYDGVDQDCGGMEGEFDQDGDGFDIPSVDWDNDGVADFSGGSDCDDNFATVFPNAPELCDGLVNACGNSLASVEMDDDNDGFVDCTIDQGGWNGVTITGGDDCSDQDASIYPNAPELCDGQDNACLGSVPSLEVDDDGDGYVECTIDLGGWDGVAITGGGDCDDTADTLYPGQSWYIDTDQDDFGDISVAQISCVALAGYVTNSDDCDDTDDTVYLHAPELCDGQVNACGTSLASDETDDDADGFVECSVDLGGWDGVSITGGGDCDDSHALTYPGIAFGDSLTDCMRDSDADGFGDAVPSLAIPGTDCDDTDNTVYPNALERCDGQVNACGTVLASDETDDDGDGYVECSIDLGGWDGAAITGGEDCNDASNIQFPGQVWYADLDNDSFGNSLMPQTSCTQPVNYILESTDCNDVEATVYPNAPELCDGQINACGGLLPVNEMDVDADGYVVCDFDPLAGDVWKGMNNVVGGLDCNNNNANVHPNKTEIPTNGVDEDCDGLELCNPDADSDGFGSSNVLDGVLYASLTCSGVGVTNDASDCDDGDPDIHPDAVELGLNLVDENCDGIVSAEATMPQVQPGDLLISEIMRDAGNDIGTNFYLADWFEVYNNTLYPINLRGLGFAVAGGNSGTVSTDLIIQPSDYVVIASSNDSTKNGGLPQVDVVKSISIGLSGTLSLSFNGSTITSVSFPTTNGYGYESASDVSIVYDVDLGADNADMNYWCASRSTTYGTASVTHIASPGYANDSCDFDLDQFLAFEDCNDNDNTMYPYATELVDAVDSNCDGIESLYPTQTCKGQKFTFTDSNNSPYQRYFLYCSQSSTLTQSTANARCVAGNYDGLISIHSATEDLTAHTFAGANSFWIGYYRLSHNTSPGNIWRWYDGSPANYEGANSGWTGSSSLHIYINASGQWVANTGSIAYRYMCAKDID